MLQSPWQIRLFGGFSVTEKSRVRTLAVTNQTALLLSMLADRLGRQLTRTELLEELWPGSEDEAGRNRFRVLLAAARRILEPAGTPVGSILICDRSHVRLSSNACRVDADEFQRNIQKANQATSRELRVEHYKMADQLYTGDFLSGSSGDWIYGRRSHYSKLQSLAQFRYAALLEESGDIAGAMQQITRSIEADPLREAPRRRALRLLVESGDVRSALSEYDEYRSLLKRSVGLVPTSEFQDWIKGLRSWAATKKPVQKAGLENEFSTEGDLQISQTEDPARIVLPPVLTSFVGRHSEAAEVSEMLPLYRWITLTGPGGIGKTRLAIETARLNLSRFGGGVFFVPIGESTNSSTLLNTILQQVGLDPGSEPLETLRRYLAQPVVAGRNACLFVLDGIDQLSKDANLVFLRLLTEIPNATILATSRSPRGAAGEVEYSLEPLEIPDESMRLDVLMANPSVQLFFERAQGASARFSVTRANASEVTALCRRLEGVPLSIELAAAQVGKSAPGTILQKLSDLGSLQDAKGWREPRHRSLYASLAFSLEALDQKLRGLYCDLCVFRGSFDAAAASHVAGAEPADLAHLAEHSLLNRNSDSTAPRYAMLDMVREFGWNQLLETDKGAIQRKHATYFRRLIADAHSTYSNDGIPQFSNLRLDLDNIRTSGEWMIATRDADLATKLATSAVTLWIHSGRQQEGRDYVRRVRETLKVDEVQLALLDGAEGHLACFQDDPASARKLIGKALPFFVREGMQRQAAAARWMLGLAAYQVGDFAECLQMATFEDDDPKEHLERWHAYRKNLAALAHCESGDLDQAERLFLENQSDWTMLGDLVVAEYCRLSLARVKWKRGDLHGAWNGYFEVCRRFDQWKDRRGLAYAVEGLGRVAADSSKFKEAARLLSAAQRLRESLGIQRDFADNLAFETALGKTKTALIPGFTSEWQAGQITEPENVVAWLKLLM